MSGFFVPQVVRTIFSRVLVLYLVVIAGFLFGTNYKTVVRSAQLQTLSRLTPGFDYYEEFFRDPLVNHPKSLEECLYYHKTVADLVPAAAGEAWAVAGFCAYKLGRSQESVSLLRKAIAKNPVFFWSHYNLGVMAFNQGDYKQAVDALSQALQLDPKATLYVLARAKVYADIHRSFRSGYDTERSLASGYERAMGVMQVSLACQDHAQAPACQNRPKFYMQIF